MLAHSLRSLRPVRSARGISTISPAALTQIETRWGKLPEAEQGAIADKLAAAQKGDWKSLTLDEKRAAYYIAYGPHGARNPRDPAMKWAVTAWTTVFFVAAVGVWQWWKTQKPIVHTMSPEWKEAEKQMAIEKKMNPFTGEYAKYRKEHPNE